MLKIIAISLYTLPLSADIVQCLSLRHALDIASLDSSATKYRDVMAGADIQYCGGLDEPTIETTGDDEEKPGPGFWITNNDNSPETKYFLYENSRDAHPWKYLSLPQGSKAFVSVCATWQGRIVRGIPSVNLDGGVHNLGTWFKSSIGPEGGWMWGDISFLEGCDGGGSVRATDGSNGTRGCLADDLLDAAPANATALKEGTGTEVLGKLVGDKPNGAARDWELERCDPGQVWIDQENSGPVMKSTDGRLEFVFHGGKA